MISPRAVKEFLGRPRKDYSRYKRFSDEKLERLVRKLTVKPPIWKKLRKHQKVAFLLGARLRRFLFLLDTGMGKTLLCIAVMRYLRKIGVVKHVLVLVPNRTNVYEWGDEIEKHCPNASYTLLKGSSAEKWALLRGTKSSFYICTYAGFGRMVCSLKRNKKGKNKLKPDRKSIAEVKEKFQGLILDESTFAKNKHALPFRICRAISKSAEAVFALTGTPFGRDPTDLWAQFFVVDHGETLGTTLGIFRAGFFTEKKNYWGGFDYKFKKEMEETLHDFLKNRSISYEVDEGDLPAVSFIPVEVRFPIDTIDYYTRAKQTLIRAHGNFQEMKSAFIRMRQIASGFVGYKDDETGTRAEFAFEENPKVEKTVQLIEQMPAGRKMLVFHEYVFTGSRLAKELRDRGIGFARLGKGGGEPGAEKKRFKHDKNCRVLIINNKAGAFGLNLQVANYIVLLERPLSYIFYKQALRRAIRQYSAFKRVFVYDLRMKNSVDLRIVQFHKQGGDLLKAIIRNPRKALGVSHAK